jgi:hypothetical protein
MISRLSFDIIDTHDFKTLGILDTTWYNPDIKVETPTIEIIPPGYTIVASPFYMIKGLNIYNSNGLGITRASCEEDLVDLPDGIWRVKYSICPNDKLFIERFFLKTDKIWCRYTQAFLTLDLKNAESKKDVERKKKLNEIEFYINGAIAASNNQDAKNAIDLYNKAEKALSRFFSDCNC